MVSSRNVPSSGGSTQVPAVIVPVDHSRVTQAILDFVSQIPASKVASSADPHAEARQLGQRAAQRAALTAGSLALPPGPLGWLTVLPELIAIWRIQAQMVSDIAAAYGMQATLGREQMLWCLFRHTAAQAFRDLVVRMGDRLLFRRVSHAVVERIAKQIGVKLGQRAAGKGLARWLPVVGALGVGAYAYYDTGQVAATAIELFSGEVVHEGDASADESDAMKKSPARTVRQAAGAAIDGAVARTVRSVAKAVNEAGERKAARQRKTPPSPD
ncbi:MAG TPA: hypothetical protein VFW82_08520 [Dyella sp.]|nr:hypothetical protein [Dyella sp.]